MFIKVKSFIKLTSLSGTNENKTSQEMPFSPIINFFLKYCENLQPKNFPSVNLLQKKIGEIEKKEKNENNFHALIQTFESFFQEEKKYLLGQDKGYIINAFKNYITENNLLRNHSLTEEEQFVLKKILREKKLREKLEIIDPKKKNPEFNFTMDKEQLNQKMKAFNLERHLILIIEAFKFFSDNDFLYYEKLPIPKKIALLSQIIDIIISHEENFGFQKGKIGRYIKKLNKYYENESDFKDLVFSFQKFFKEKKAFYYEIKEYIKIYFDQTIDHEKNREIFKHLKKKIVENNIENIEKNEILNFIKKNDFEGALNNAKEKLIKYDCFLDEISKIIFHFHNGFFNANKDGFAKDLEKFKKMAYSFPYLNKFLVLKNQKNFQEIIRNVEISYQNSLDQKIEVLESMLKDIKNSIAYFLRKYKLKEHFIEYSQKCEVLSKLVKEKISFYENEKICSKKYTTYSNKKKKSLSQKKDYYKNTEKSIELLDKLNLEDNYKLKEEIKDIKEILIPDIYAIDIDSFTYDKNKILSYAISFHYLENHPDDEDVINKLFLSKNWEKILEELIKIYANQDIVPLDPSKNQNFEYLFKKDKSNLQNILSRILLIYIICLREDLDDKKDFNTSKEEHMVKAERTIDFFRNRITPFFKAFFDSLIPEYCIGILNNYPLKKEEKEELLKVMKGSLNMEKFFETTYDAMEYIKDDLTFSNGKKDRYPQTIVYEILKKFFENVRIVKNMIKSLQK